MGLPRLTIAILTFRRPAQLATTLDAVVVGAVASASLADMEILVVDNDPIGSARQTAGTARTLGVRYVVEPTPGIAAARNRALAEAAESKLLAFIDDDEIPEPEWLTALVRTWSHTAADAVAGRVVSVLPDDADPWISGGGFFDRPSRPTGTRLRAAPSGNLLLDLESVRSKGIRFDETLALSGGEDTVFTSQLAEAGGVIVWCQESVAYDPLGPERLTRAWVRRRAFSQGNVLIRTRLRLATTQSAQIRVRVVGLLGGAARIVTGGGRALWGLVTRDDTQNARGERTMRRGAGVLAGSFGHEHGAYRRAPGVGG